jgi:hypothetical protein
LRSSWKLVKELPLSAASGLARVAGGFWAVADDLNHLTFLPDKGRSFRRRIFPGEPPKNEEKRKRVKKDLESLIDLGGGRLIAFPSGSKNRRCRGSLIELHKSGRFKRATEMDFRPLMELLDGKIPQLNIEGGFVTRRLLVLLQRGNGRARFNAVIKLKLEGFERGLKGHWGRAKLDLKIKRVPLGRWDGVELAFTDAFYHDGAAYFSAAAEAGGDTYRDGKVAGSVVGCLRKGRKPVILARLKGEKIEGLALKSSKNGLLEIIAVTDADDPGRPSRMFRAFIKRPD